MTLLSRREFGRVVSAGVPLATILSSAQLDAIGTVRLGVSTSSFRDFPRVTDRDNMDDVIRGAASLTHHARGACPFERRARSAQHQVVHGRHTRVPAANYVYAGTDRGNQRRRACGPANMANPDSP